MIDARKYTIPWMGDDRLKIDRSVVQVKMAWILSVVKKGLAFVDCFNQDF